MSDGTALVSTAEAAQAIGVSTSTLTRYANDGTLKPALRTPGGPKGRRHTKWDLEKLKADYRMLTEQE